LKTKKSNSKSDTLVLMLSNFKTFKKERQEGTISREIFNSEKQGITKSLLEIIDEW
jgi:hypothetical protein